jgi:hypothetical protein
MRRVVVSFKNTSSNPCGLVGYPDANLVTAAGGVLVHVENRPALAAHALTLAPGDVATANVESYAIDTGTGNSCPRGSWRLRVARVASRADLQCEHQLRGLRPAASFESCY